MLTENHRKVLTSELMCQEQAVPEMADIVVVFHNQQEHLQTCLNRIAAGTTNYRLHLWDNASDSGCRKLALSARPATLIRRADNWGFVRPNNILAAETKSPYLILLNSDAFVLPGWKEALLGWLQRHPECGSVGFQGGRLTAGGFGGGDVHGECEYVHGWCVAVRRETIQSGLFDERFEFCHCEDSDLGLRLRAEGLVNYALHLRLADHVGSATMQSLGDDDRPRLARTFHENHAKFAAKWADRLPKHPTLAASVVNHR